MITRKLGALMRGKATPFQIVAGCVLGAMLGFAPEVRQAPGLIALLVGALPAVALGARGTYIGRAFLYGLSAMGEAGVTRTLQIIHKELDLSMAFCGHTRMDTLDRGILLPGTAPG